MKAPQLVAVYGTLRRNHGNYKYFLEDQKFIGEFKTEPIYTMLSNGGFPMVFLNGETSIVCEVFHVISQDTLQELDGLEGYPNFYNRKQVTTPWGDAWMYFINGDSKEYSNGRPEIKSGDWNEFIKFKVLEND